MSTEPCLKIEAAGTQMVNVVLIDGMLVDRLLYELRYPQVAFPRTVVQQIVDGGSFPDSQILW